MVNFNWFKRFLLREKPEERMDTPVEAVQFREPPSIYGTKVWAVGGGKGGVGKTFMAANLGILLSKEEKRVLVIDADLGAANLHTLLGVEGGRHGLCAFFKGEYQELDPIVTKTPFPNLDIVSGANDSLDVADVNREKVARLKSALRKIEYDYVVIDIGPGTTSNLLDLFLMSNDGIVMSTPEPTTIENNYRFLKCLFLRKIRTLADSQPDGRLKEALQKIFSEHWNQRVRTVSDIIGQIFEYDYELGRMLKNHVEATSISMVMNQSKKGEERNIGPSIMKACSDYFGVGIGFLGSVPYEDAVSDSIKLRKPLLIHYAESSAAREVHACFSALYRKGAAMSGN